MVIKVGINGFGRVGRVVFRTCLEHPEVEVCAINDPAIEVNYICYLIKYDSTHGKLKNNISHTEDEIIVDDLRVKVFQEKNPTGIPWDTVGAQYIVEASGMFTSLDKASGHLIWDSVKRVIVTAPCVDVPMVIFGVNEKKIKPDNKVISCGSSTLYCLAPIIKVLEDSYGVEEGFITSIHAMTPSLKPLDGLCLKGKHWRDHRSITQNIIPAATGACKALGRIIPAVRDRMCGLAFRVPIANVSVLDLTVRLKKLTSLENIASDIKKFNETTKNIMKINTDEAVSSDFIGDSYSCILDISSSIQLKSNSFKLICWYENEYSYACRVVDLITFSENQLIELDAHKNQCDNVNVKAQIAHPLKVPAPIENVPEAKVTVDRRQARSKRTNASPNVSTSYPEGRVMICKLWNDEVPDARDRPTSFFHACTSLAPQTSHDAICINAQERLETIKQDTIGTRAQERLEKMKQEFSKMVNITETLLKKSYNSKLSLNALESSNEINKGKCDDSTHIITLKVAEDPIGTDNNTSICDIRDNIMSSSTVNSKHVGNFNNEQAHNTMREKDKSDYSMTTTESVVESVKEKTLPLSNGNNSFVAKTFTGIFNGLSNLQLQFSTVKTDNLKDEQKIEIEKKCEFKNLDENIDRAETQSRKLKQTVTNNEQLTVFVDKLISNNTSEIIKPNSNVSQITQQKQHDDTNKEDIKDEQLQDDPLDTKNNQLDIKDDQLDIKGDQQDIKNEQLDIKYGQLEMKVDQRGGEFVRIAESDDSIHDDVHVDGNSCSDVPISFAVDAAWTSSPHYRKTQDIYDKLDSASGSDNSFDMEKKKSEIITIADLTNSLEDLDRLDKICRIMEISDELSDRLFAALNKRSEESNVNVTKKRWSFKDLCEKVNLDEFCNKVFGK